ncbi:unnamed protein product [Pleuronectes platessa]|uniref:Uncharacterized protein n=1 Tax=Pleuronectes platessa TaxID=8262 RepID=A0A9N7U9R2_PLEPL|nr:unnamed protein product [Pleuronectes platessa]
MGKFARAWDSSSTRSIHSTSMASEPRGQRSAPLGPHSSGGRGGAESEHQHQDFIHRESAVTRLGVRGVAAGLRADGLCGSGLRTLITGVSPSTTLSYAEFFLNVPPYQRGGGRSQSSLRLEEGERGEPIRCHPSFLIQPGNERS